MTIVILFNAPDKPENMGASQQPDSLINFCEEHKDLLLNYTINNDETLLTFVKPDGEYGYAVLTKVPDGFQN